jgi:hypothetical protein
MPNTTIEERIRRDFGVPFEQWVRDRSDSSIQRLAGEAECHVVPLKKALDKHGFKEVTVKRIVPKDRDEG